MASTVVLLAAALALGQPMTEAEILARIGLPGESSQSARRLLTADQLAAQKKWAEAVEYYERIIREGGDDLVPVDAYRSLQARWLCHRRLADLPAEALRLYRSHVDNQAKRWLDQGTAAHDPQILRRLPDEAFCSRFTDQALDLLGDLAFERGAFDEAEHWWRLLALPASAKDRPENRDQLIFPDPRVDGARIRAKQLLALLFRGQPAAADKEWQAFRQLHAEAAGELAGRNGNYAEIVHDLITREGTDSGTNAPENWTSFAGDPTRNFLVAGGQQSLARLSGLDRPTWDVPLHPVAREDPPSQAGEHPLRDSRALAYFPLIVGNQALVSDARYVRGYELTTGRLTLEYNVQPDASDEELGITLPPDRPVLRQPSRAAFPADLAYTLTADGERVYARLGAQGISAGKEKAAPSFLVCLDLHWADSGALLRWKVKATASGNSPAFFEGSPVAHAGSVYGAVTRLAGIETITAIACYDADTGSLQWQREVCSTQELRDGDRRYQHQLVTLAGPNIVYCSHSGAIVALDAPTGRRVWGVRYPSRGSKTAEGDLSPRSLAPCLYDGQRLYVAPTDYDRILCLDASTGRQLWESASLEVVHLLGVAQGRIIFSSTTPRACIRALDASDGNDVPGWLFPWAAKLTPCGRGLLAGNRVLWPTWEQGGRLCLLDQASGELVQVARGIRGNLAAARGCLVAADRDTLSAYIPESLLLSRRRAEAGAPGHSALDRYRLALAEAGSGRTVQALADFQIIERTAGPGIRYQGIALPELARQGRHSCLLQAAAWAARQKQWDAADQFLSQAASPAFPVAARVRALDQRALLWKEQGQEAKAIAIWKSILDDPTLGQGQLTDERGAVKPVSLYIRRRLEQAKGQPPADGDRPEASVGSTRQSSVLSPEGTPGGPALDLALPLRQTWQLPAANSEDRPEHCVLLPMTDRRSEPGARVLTVRGDCAACWDSALGKMCWKQALIESPQALCRATNRVLIIGRDHVCAWREQDGQVAWTWSARPDPWWQSPPEFDPGSDAGEARFTSFQAAGGRLFLLEDDRRLRVLDVRSGEELWNAWAPDALLGLPAPVGRFRRPFWAGNHGVLLQATDDRVWLFDSRTGKRLGDMPTCQCSWGHPPLDLDGRHVCLAVDPEHIVTIDSATGLQVWKHALNWPASLTGKMPQLLGDEEHLLVAAEHNYGHTLMALDPRAGMPRWPEEIFLGADRTDLDRSALGPSAVYLLCRQVLQARSLADGSVVWQQTLPKKDIDWQLRLSGRHLIAAPATVTLAAAHACWLSWPAPVPPPGSPALAPAVCAAGLAGLFPAPEVPEDYPILLCDAASGRVLQRLDVHLGDERSIGLRSQVKTLAVQVSANGLTVVQDCRAWRWNSSGR